ncbi:MAG: DUF4870 domain-containing protein [Ornithinimicrobium sp.]
MSTPPPPPPGQSDDAQPEYDAGYGDQSRPVSDGEQHPPQYSVEQDPPQNMGDENSPQYAGNQGAPQYAGQQSAPQYGGQPSGSGTPLNPSEEKTWTVLAHLSAPIAALVSVGMLNFVGPLVIWAIYKDRSAKVRHAAAGAFNFNLTLWIAYFALVVLGILTLGIGFLLALPLIFVIWVVSMVLHIMAAVKASSGEVYTYPAQIKVLK